HRGRMDVGNSVIHPGPCPDWGTARGERPPRTPPPAPTERRRDDDTRLRRATDWRRAPLFCLEAFGSIRPEGHNARGFRGISSLAALSPVFHVPLRCIPLT